MRRAEKKIKTIRRGLRIGLKKVRRRLKKRLCCLLPVNIVL